MNELKLSLKEKRELLELLEEKQRRKDENKLFDLFPTDGPLRRELYAKHLAFFKAGLDNRERLFLAGNRVGKTIAGGYESTCDLIGWYPDWWKGKKFDRPTKILVAGDTITTTRDIIQEKMLGPVGNFGTGLIPKDDIIKTVSRSGVSGAVDYALIKHRPTGGESTLLFRSYDQGRKIFQGFELDKAWMDEECPIDVYEEALIRTMTTGGGIVLTFTPLQGLTPLVLSFLQDGKIPE